MSAETNIAGIFSLPHLMTLEHFEMIVTQLHGK